jgi:hypothetical protein
MYIHVFMFQPVRAVASGVRVGSVELDRKASTFFATREIQFQQEELHCGMQWDPIGCAVDAISGNIFLISQINQIMEKK